MFLDENNKIQEDIQGKFEQYPIRLAWAVTIHKSQGLTFDRMIIDAGESFVSGQVYVVLSRCRTLNGIVLKSKITPEVIFGDNRINNFQSETKAKENLTDIIEREKYAYSLKKLITNIDIYWLKDNIISWKNQINCTKFLDQRKGNIIAKIILSETTNLIEIFDKFKNITNQKYADFLNKKIYWEEIENKCKGAINFFYQNVMEKIFIPFSNFYSETKGVAGLKAYNKETKDFLQELEDYLGNLKKIYLLDKPLFINQNDEKNLLKIKKKPSHLITLQMLNEGKTHMKISKERGFATSTIFGHLAKLAGLGLLEMHNLEKILGKHKVKTFKEYYDNFFFSKLTDWKEILPDNFDFHEIRLLYNFFNTRK